MNSSPSGKGMDVDHNDLHNTRHNMATTHTDAVDSTIIDALPIEVNDEANGRVDARNQLNDLTAKEWIVETVSVWNQRGLGAGHKDAQIERQHPAPFSFTDVGRLIRFFTKSGAVVLDPFVGVGSTL